MGRPRSPELEHEEPAPGEPRRYCSSCQKWWSRRIHLYSGLCPNCRRERSRRGFSPEQARKLVVEAAASAAGAPMLPRAGGGKISLLDPNLGAVVADDPVTSSALDAYIASAVVRR